MLESNPESFKRYAPPPQRNRMPSRRKSGDRFEKVNYSYGVDGEKSRPFYSTSTHAVDHGEGAGSYMQNENTRLNLIPINGCSGSDAAKLLNERWAAAMHSCNDPLVDLSEKPIIYSGATGSSWNHFKLRHQMDFLVELRRAIHAQSSTVSTDGYQH